MRRLLFGEDSKAEEEPETPKTETSFPSFGRLLFPQSFSFGFFSKKDESTENSRIPDETATDGPIVSEESFGPPTDDTTPPQLEKVITKRSPVPNLSIPGLLKLSAVPGDPAEARSSARDLKEPPSSKEFRRICSEIVPGQLCISGWLVAEDWSQLESAGITHVINTACSVSKCPFPDAICYLPLAVEDSKNEDIESYFYPCIEFIEEAIRSGGRVLVHCMEGVSRSCSIVIAYIMWKRGLGYQEAQTFVQASRPICQPNAGFICQLLAFENRQPENEVRRVTLRKFMDKFVLVAVICSDQSLDPRFSYFRRTGNTFDIVISRDTRIPDFHYQLAKDAIERIARLESIDPQILEDQYEATFASEVNSKYDSDFAACLDLFQQTPASEQLPEDPCTARSRKSHGSIDSARDSDRVRVHLIIPEMPQLEPPIPYFDSDDLDSRCMYAFLLHSEVIVWIGDEAADLTEPDLVELVGRLLAQEGRRADIQLVHQGAEPAPFWDLFQEG